MAFKIVTKGSERGGFSSWEEAAEVARKMVLFAKQFDVSIREEER